MISLGTYDDPTSTQVYPHPRSVHIRHAVRERNLLGLWNYTFALRMQQDWVGLALKQLDLALASGGWWHLWGHSWEIERIGAWRDLEVVLREAGASGALQLTNSEWASMVRGGRG